MKGTAPMTDQVTVPALPHWESIPDDPAAATREIKAALKASIEAAGTTPQAMFDALEAEIAADVEEIKAEVARGESAWPVVQYSDIVAGTVPAETMAKVHKRGCAVVRGTFERTAAEKWDRDLIGYTEGNQFFENYRGPGDDFFMTVEASRPEIYPIYWSTAQMEARQSPRMATVQSFMNSFWASESEGQKWFDPDRDALYPDRVRRRPPGTTSNGLSPHIDAGNLDLWMVEGYQKHFRHLWNGDLDAYDPWDAAYRTDASQYEGSTMCSAFRTFQGWTALSEMKHDQGVLHVVPIPRAMAYLMLRPLLDDVADDDMCGVAVSRTFPANEKWHPLLMEARAGIPDVEPGDTVWWHCDMIHSVAPVTEQEGWGNVMYIPAAPWCGRNERFASKVYEAFAAGKSSPDFPDEHYEETWPDRFTPEQLNEIGRRGFGLAD